MLRRTVLTLAAAAVSVLATACTDRSPTLQGDEFFPGGRPTTVQVLLPADSFFQAYGDFAGYPRSAISPTLLVVAEDYGGTLDAHVLFRLVAPLETPEYTRGGTQRRDTIRALTAGRLVAPIDSLASTAGPQTVFRLWELAQGYDPAVATWEVAGDTAGGLTPWAEAGGTRGALLAETTWTQSAAGDSLAFALDSATVNRITAPGFPGLLVTASSGARLQTQPFSLRTGAYPKGVTPDTVIPLTISGVAQTFVFTPEPPRDAAALEVGGIRSARTLFRLDLDTRVAACAPDGPSCGTVPLREVRLNEVALLLRPRPAPAGFEARDTVPLSIAEITEPELGARAPLGTLINLPRLPFLALYAPGDTLVTIPVTPIVLRALATDSTVAGDFALLSIPEANTFGALYLEPTPRLRITYTLPVAPRFP